MGASLPPEAGVHGMHAQGKGSLVRKLIRLVEIDSRTSNDATHDPMEEQARADIEEFWGIYGEGLPNLAKDSELWATQTAGLKAVQKLEGEHAANLRAEKARANLTARLEKLDFWWR